MCPFSSHNYINFIVTKSSSNGKRGGMGRALEISGSRALFMLYLQSQVPWMFFKMSFVIRCT